MVLLREEAFEVPVAPRFRLADVDPDAMYHLAGTTSLRHLGAVSMNPREFTGIRGLH